MGNPAAALTLRDHLNASLVGMWSCLKGSALDQYDDACANRMNKCMTIEANAWKAKDFGIARRNKIRRDRTTAMAMSAHAALMTFAPRGAYLGNARDVQYPQPSWWVDNDSYRLSPRDTTMDTAWKAAISRLPVGDLTSNIATLSRCQCTKEELDQLLLPITRVYWSKALTRIEKECGINLGPISPILPVGKNKMIMTKEIMTDGVFRTIAVVTDIASRLTTTTSFPLTTAGRVSGLMPI